MPEQGSFSTSQIRRRLGIRSARESLYRSEGIQPVTIVGDFSNSYAPEQIEGRAVFTQDVYTTGTSVDFELNSRGAGGCVVEYLGLTSDLAGAKANWAIYDAPVPFVPGLSYKQEIGGTATYTIITRGINTLLPTGWSWPVPYELPTDRLYVAPGHYLRMTVRVPSPPQTQTAYLLLVMREIPELLGAP